MFGERLSFFLCLLGQEAAQRAQETEKRQRQIEEMRRRMLYEDEEPGGGFSSEDQASLASSSVEGVFIPRYVWTHNILSCDAFNCIVSMYSGHSFL